MALMNVKTIMRNPIKKKNGFNKKRKRAMFVKRIVRIILFVFSLNWKKKIKNKVFGESMIFYIKPWSPINAEVHSLKWTPMTTKTYYFYYNLVNKYLYTLKITRFYLKWFLKYFAKLNHKIIKIHWQIAVILCICTWRLFINSKNGENVYLNGRL